MSEIHSIIHGHAPRVVAVLDGNEADITYACTFDIINGEITLPENLPGGTMVFADGQLIYTAPMTLADRDEAKERNRYRPHPLAVGIRAAVLMMQEAEQQ